MGPSLGLVLAGVFLLTGAIDLRLFQWFVVAAALFSGMELAWMMNQAKLEVPLIPAGLGASLFPAFASLFGEQTALLASGILFLAVGTMFVLRGQRPGIIPSVAGSILVALYIGLLGSYLVLIRQSRFGFELTAALVLMVAGHRAGKWAGSSWRPLRRLLEGGAVWTPVFGILGSVVGGFISLFFLPRAIGILPMVAIAIIVGLSSTVGDFAASMFRMDANLGVKRATLPAQGGLVLSVNSILLAAPAFFYGFKLYLT